MTNNPILKEVIGLRVFEPLTTDMPIIVAITPIMPNANGNINAFSLAVPTKRLQPTIMAVT